MHKKLSRYFPWTPLSVGHKVNHVLALVHVTVVAPLKSFKVEIF